MEKVLVICGATATGKTSLALFLATQFDVEIVSADSRQVYRYMDIGTGKDVPEGYVFERSHIEIDSNRLGYYTNGTTRIWGYDLVDPREEFSVSDYVRLMKPVLSDILSRNKMPIVVGGSGFYIKGLIDGLGTISIGKDPTLRMNLEKRSVEELFELLRVVDPVKSASLNSSDRKNPRRLIRAIEVAKNHEVQPSEKTVAYDTEFIGLKMRRDRHNSLIISRVMSRVDQGFEDELHTLLKINVLWSDQSMSSLGYRQWKEVLDGSLKRTEAIDEWIHEESQYAKRQMVWFKRDPRINWFDVLDKDFKEKVVNVVKRWHNVIV